MKVSQKSFKPISVDAFLPDQTDNYHELLPVYSEKRRSPVPESVSILNNYGDIGPIRTNSSLPNVAKGKSLSQILSAEAPVNRSSLIRTPSEDSLTPNQKSVFQFLMGDPDVSASQIDLASDTSKTTQYALKDVSALLQNRPVETEITHGMDNVFHDDTQETESRNVPNVYAGTERQKKDNNSYADDLWEALFHYKGFRDKTEDADFKVDSFVENAQTVLRDIPVYEPETWTPDKVLQWRSDKSENGSDKVVEDFKDHWIYSYRDVIKKAAETYGIPVDLLAGVAWIELGGDPMFIDPAAYGARKYVPQWIWNAMQDVFPNVYDALYKDPDKTSFGNISMQLRVAAEEMGIDPNDLNFLSEIKIAEVLSDPKLNLMLAAKYLAYLKSIDFADIPSDKLTEDQIVWIANRYNMGTGSLETIQNHVYGQRFMERIDIIHNMLYPES